MMTIDSINLELTSRCNLTCRFCPKAENISRPDTQMSFAQFRSIIDQCRDLGVSRVYLFLFGEPLVCSWFTQGVDYLARRGIQDVHITTNGVLLGKRGTDAILRNVASVTVSMTGTSQGVYRKFQGHRSRFRLADIERNLRAFIRLRDRARRHTSLTLSYILNRDSLAEWRAYYERWREVVDDIVFADLQVYNLSGYRLGTRNIRSCSELTARNKLNFLSNGLVTVCCEDFNGTLALGDARRQRVAELWTGGKLHEAKRRLLDGHWPALYPACRNCYMICRYLNFITAAQVRAADRLRRYLDDFFPGKRVAVYGANSQTAAMLHDPEFRGRIAAVVDEHRLHKFVDLPVTGFAGLAGKRYDVLVVNHENTGKNAGLTKNRLHAIIRRLGINRNKTVIYHSSTGGTDLRGADLRQMLAEHTR